MGELSDLRIGHDIVRAHEKTIRELRAEVERLKALFIEDGAKRGFLMAERNEARAFVREIYGTATPVQTRKRAMEAIESWDKQAAPPFCIKPAECAKTGRCPRDPVCGN